MIIIYLILAAILFLVIFGIWQKKKRAFNTLYAYLINGAYLCVLLGFLIYYSLIPEEGFAKPSPNANGLLEKALEIDRGSIAERIEDYREIKSWSFKLEGDEIKLVFPRVMDSGIKVYAKYKQTDDNTIEVRQLASYTVLKDIDLTDRISQPAEVELDGSCLKVVPPPKQKIKLCLFQGEFHLRQFVDTLQGYDMHSPSGRMFVLGRNILYVELPKGVRSRGFSELAEKNQKVHNIHEEVQVQ